MKEEDNDLMGIIDEVPFNCLIEDKFVIKMLSFDFNSMIKIATDVVKMLEYLENGLHLTGGVSNVSEEIFYEVTVEKLDKDNVVILDIDFIDLDSYLDYINNKQTVKIITNDSL
jgi:hypothetical protein